MTTPSPAAAEYVTVASLRPWVKNPRKNDPAVAAVADSIKRFGFGSPIIARRENGEIIAGHTRLKAAIRLGLAEVPVRYLDLSEAEAHALALADNRVGELADWDGEALVDVLRELDASGANIGGLGWDSSELDALLDKVSVDDVKWKEFDETVGDEAPSGKDVKCPHCGEVFSA